MVEQEDVQRALAPSKEASAKATGIARTVALVLLFTAVLPAEYGIDPLKTGKLLHLTDLAKASESKVAAKAEVAGRWRSSRSRSGWHLHRAIEDHSYGSFTAPSTAIHGWFWENNGKNQVDIHLMTAGFYGSAKMYAGEAPVPLDIQDPK